MPSPEPPDRPDAVMPDLALARRVLQTEAAAILALVDRVDAHFARAVEVLRDCRGRVIVTGMGKSGIIARKIAATLSSTGTPAFFLHPAEAIHGDLGVIQAGDVVLGLSYSGETGEILRLLETIRRTGATIVALTGVPTSTLGRFADVTLDCRVAEEACPLNLVPTASTTAALALGDALAMTVMRQKGFTRTDFGRLHPGGTLGARLKPVRRLMHSGRQLPLIGEDASMHDAVVVMTEKRLGVVGVTNSHGHLVGVITDGDLRRNIERGLEHTAGEFMTTDPKTVGPDALVADAVELFDEHKITAIFVVDEDGGGKRPLGVLHIHDCPAAL